MMEKFKGFFQGTEMPNAAVAIKLTPIEVKYRAAGMAPGDMWEALAQAENFGRLLDALWMRQPARLEYSLQHARHVGIEQRFWPTRISATILGFKRLPGRSYGQSDRPNSTGRFLMLQPSTAVSQSQPATIVLLQRKCNYFAASKQSRRQIRRNENYNAVRTGAGRSRKSSATIVQ
jgi:hypothetical protein